VLLINRSADAKTVTLRPELLQEGPDTDAALLLDGVWKEALTGAGLTAVGNAITLCLPGRTAQLYIKN